MCNTLSEMQSLAVDLAPELTRAVTNVVCSLCFNSSYKRGDPEFEAMLHYSQGIVDTVAKDSPVDIFPWLQVKFHLWLSNRYDHLPKVFFSHNVKNDVFLLDRFSQTKT